MKDICQKCEKHKASINWVGRGGMMDFVHGMYSRWCRCCALREQIKHLEKETKRLPRLKKKLKNVQCS